MPAERRGQKLNQFNSRNILLLSQNQQRQIVACTTHLVAADDTTKASSHQHAKLDLIFMDHSSFRRYFSLTSNELGSRFCEK